MPYTLSRLGQADGAGDALALFRTVFPGEVLAAFNLATKLLPLQTIRTIESGISAEFPVTGRSTSAYHVVGTEVDSTVFAVNKRVIGVDAEVTSSHFVAKWDEAINHFNTRNEIANKIGNALAVRQDRTIAKVGVLAARASSVISGEPGGSVINNAAAATDGLVLASMLFDAAQALDEKEVPEDGRYVALRPAQHRLLGQTEKVLDSDIGGSGSYSKGTVTELAGLRFVKTNALPSTNIVAPETGVNANNTYHGDFSNTVALVWTPEAMGTVRLANIMVEKEYYMERRGTMILGAYIAGHGILNPHCAVEISKAP